MVEVEGDFADDGSPLLRTVLTVARALDGGCRGGRRYERRDPSLSAPVAIQALCRASDGSAPFTPAWCAQHLPLIAASMDLLEADDAEFAARFALMCDEGGRAMLDELAGQLQRLGTHIADLADALGLTAARIRDQISRGACVPFSRRELKKPYSTEAENADRFENRC